MAWSRSRAMPALPRCTKAPPASRRWTCWGARCCCKRAASACATSPPRCGCWPGRACWLGACVAAWPAPWRAVQWNTLTLRLMLKAKADPEQVGASSVDYLMYCGYVMMAYHWALMAQRAEQALHSGQGPESAAFYQAKLQTAQFYFERLLPRGDAHHRMALAPGSTLLQMPVAAMAG